MESKYLLLPWEIVSAARRNICKICKDFLGFIFSFYLYHLRYHSRKQIPHNVAIKHHTNKFIPKIHNFYERLCR